MLDEELQRRIETLLDLTQLHGVASIEILDQYRGLGEGDHVKGGGAQPLGRDGRIALAGRYEHNVEIVPGTHPRRHRCGENHENRDGRNHDGA